MKQYILLILFCLLIILFLLTRCISIEHYRHGHNIKKEAYDKPVVSSNNEFSNDIPIYVKDLKLSKDIKSDRDKFINDISNYSKFITKLTDTLPHDITFITHKTPFNILYKKNKKTWKDRWTEINPDFSLNLKYINSDIDDVNRINKSFLKKTNEYHFRFGLDKKTILRYGMIDYQIYKYRIERIKVSSNNIKKYYITIVLVNEYSHYQPTYLLEGCYYKNNVYLTKIIFVGFYNSSFLLLPHGLKQGSSRVILNKLYKKNNNILEHNLDKVLADRNNYLEGYKLKSNYACFSTDLAMLENIKLNDEPIVSATDMRECETRYNWYGKQKPHGVWDRPCIKNEDCIFYQANKNYPNNYGKCNESGLCELPSNMKPIGYRYFNPLIKYKPLCYNCKSDKWLQVTPLESCCDEQFDKKKYPFLNGPDYVFKDDQHKRYNYYLQQHCVIKNGDMECKM